MTQKPKILNTLPCASLQAIKDGWRSIAFSVWGKKQLLSDRVGHTLRKILKIDDQSEVALDEVREIIDLIGAHRVQIIELLQNKECIKTTVAGHSKREREARVELSGKVLDEIFFLASTHLKKV